MHWFVHGCFIDYDADWLFLGTRVRGSTRFVQSHIACKKKKNGGKNWQLQAEGARIHQKSKIIVYDAITFEGCNSMYVMSDIDKCLKTKLKTKMLTKTNAGVVSFEIFSTV